MERLFGDELIELKRRMLSMSDLVQQMVRFAIDTLSRCDADMFQQVVQQKERVESIEYEIDRESLRLFALRQPVAIDLRFLIAALKICGYLDRVAEESVNIAKSSHRIKNCPERELPEAFANMVFVVERMLRNSVHAFVHHDVDEAESVCAEDWAASQIYSGYLDDAASGWIGGPGILFSAHLLLAFRSLERIACYAANIAEEVIFIEEGKSVRHI